jgi:hypothetical protein
LAARRLKAGWLLTGALVCALSFSVGVLVAGPIFAAGAQRAIVFAYLQRSSPLARYLSVTLLARAGFDATRATREVRSLISPLPLSEFLFQEASGSIDIASGAASTSSPVAFRDGLFSELPLVSGRAPMGTGQVVVPQSMAASLGVRPGSQIRLRDGSRFATASVVGVYSTTRGVDPLVFGDDRLLSAGNLRAGGRLPVLTTGPGFAAAVHAIGENYFALEWDAEPRMAGLSVSDLSGLVQRETRAASRVTTAINGSSMSSQLGSLVPGARRVVARGLAPIYVVVGAVALVGLGVLLGVGVLRLDRQSFEIAVLKTRGVRVRELVAMQSAEVVLAALLALPLSLAVGLGLAVLGRSARGPALRGAVFPISLTPLAVVVAVAALAVAALALVLISVPHMRRTVVQERRRLSRQARPVWLRLPYGVILLVVGAFGYAELRRHGTFNAAGNLDPFVLGVPTLLLIGGGLLSVRLLVSGFTLGERASDRLASPALYLGLRRLSRSAANASLALLIVLSAGLLTFASSVRTTALTRNQDAAREQLGADWNLLVNAPAQVTVAAKRLGANSTLTFHGSAQTSAAPVGFANVLGVDPSTFASGGWWQPQDSTLALSSLLRRLEVPALGIPVPPQTRLLKLRVAAPSVHGLHLWAVGQDASGTVADRDLGTLRRGQWTYGGHIAGLSRLLSIVVSPPPAAGAPLFRAQRFTLGFDSLLLSGPSGARSVDISRWRGLNTGGANVATRAARDGGVRAGLAVVNRGPVGAIAPPAPPLPVVVGGVEQGRPRSGAAVQIGQLQVPLRVVGALRAVPSMRGADEPIVAVSLPALTERFDQIAQPPTGGAFVVLAMGAASPLAATRAAGFQVTNVARASTIEEQLASSKDDLALGMEFAASVAGVMLAALALALGVYFGGRRHDYEFASLEALGARTRDVFSTLAVEHGLVLVCSLVIGCAVGIGLFALVLSSVAPAPSEVPAETLIDWPAILLASAVAAGTLLLAVALATARIRSLSPLSLLRGEPE